MASASRGARSQQHNSRLSAVAKIYGLLVERKCGLAVFKLRDIEEALTPWRLANGIKGPENG